MTQEQPSVWGESSSDTELIAAVRNGETAAFGVLYERHAGAARTVARQYMASSADADDVVADAFAKVLSILSIGRGPDTAFRAYLFTVVRRLAYVAVNHSRRMQPTDDAGFESVFGPSASSEEPALEGFERTTVARAYQMLPERWQAALWYSEVEGLTPAQFAPSLGLTANGAAALAYRAREGLRQQYLQQHLTVSPDPACVRANSLLAGYVREGLSRRDTTLVENHLETCGECRALLVELGDVSHGMRAIIAPLVLGVAGLGVIGGGLPLFGTITASATAETAAAATAAGPGVGAGSAAGGAPAAGSTAGGSTAGSTSGAAGGTGNATGSASAGASATAASPVAVATATGAAGAAAAGVAGATAAEAAGSAPPSAGLATGSTPASAGTGSEASAVGVGSAGSAGGAGSAAGTTGLGALLAGIPGGLVGAAAAVVVGAGVAISAALGVFSGGSDATPPPAAASPGTDATAPPAASPTPVVGAGTDQPSPGDPSTDPTAPGNTLLPPTTSPVTNVPAGAPGPQALPAAPRGHTATAPSVLTPQVPPLSPPTGPQAPDLAPEPTTDPTTPSASPAALRVSFDAGTGLVARQDNAVELVVSNSGGTAAKDVALALTLPDTLRFVAKASATNGVFAPRLLRTAADGWTCAVTGPGAGQQVVHCIVDEIAPAAHRALALVFHAEDSVTADLSAQVFVGQRPIGKPWPFTSPVAVAPARLASTVTPVAELVAGQPGHLALTVANGGQVTASDPSVSLELPAASGLSWRTEPIDTRSPAGEEDGSGASAPGSRAVSRPAPGSTPGWACDVVSDALTCAGPQVQGDQSATVVVPVAVAAGVTFTGDVTHSTTFAGAAATAPGARSRLSVTVGGLSAVSILEGHLQVAHVAGALGTALHLTPHDAGRAPGTTVREATLVWSGRDAQGLDATALSAVELRTDSGDRAREQVTGSAVVLPAAADGTSLYWGSADVTALVAGHAQTGRWFVAPQHDALLPADLTWSLTVVYEHAALPPATVTVLLGPSAAEAVSPALALPAAGPVRIEVTGTAHDAGDFVVNDTVLAVSTGDLPDVVTYRSDGLLAAAHGPLGLSLEPGASDLAVLAVHLSATGEAPVADLSGVLDQPQPRAAERLVTVDVAAVVEIGAGVEVPVTVRNDAGVDLTDVAATFHLPSGVTATAPPGLSCDDVAPDGPLTCALGPLAVDQSTVVPLALTAVDGLAHAETIAYTVTGTDTLTGEQAEATGTFGVTAWPGAATRGTWHGSVAVTEVGAPLMRCSPVSCWFVNNSWWVNATNDRLTMRPLNDAGGVTSSSSSTLAIPQGAAVKHAGLYWSANRKAGGTFSQDLTSARLRTPGSSTYLPVVGEVLGEVTDSTGRVSYQSYADVTDLVTAHGAGEWTVADIALAGLAYGSGWEDTVASQDLYAGWSLVVVYEDTALSAGSVTVLDTPFAVTESAGLSVDFLGDGATTATLGAVAWEGDRRESGDQLALNTVALRPLLGGSTPNRPRLGWAADAFDSTAWGSTSRYENTLGVDAKKFETATTLAGVNTVSATTTGDEYVLGVLTVTTR